MDGFLQMKVQEELAISSDTIDEKPKTEPQPRKSKKNRWNDGRT